MKCLLLCLILGVGGWAGQATRVEVASTPAQVGQYVTIRAAVYLADGSRPVSQGNVAFTADGVTIPGCEAIWAYRSAGAADCVTRFDKLATYRVVATYTGTGAYEASSAAIDIAVGKLYPSPASAYFPPKPMYGGLLELNVRVYVAPRMPKPTGTVTFSEGGRDLVTREVTEEAGGSVAGLGLPLPVGRHTIDARYSGDDLYQAARAPSLDVTITKGTPAIYLASSPAQLRQPVTLGALVQPEMAGGTLTFTGVPGCANIPLRESRASCPAIFNSLGKFPVGAEYSGDANLNPGSTTMQLTVGRVVAGLYVAFTPAAPVYGEPVQVGVLALGATGVAPPTGTVAFNDSMGNAGAGVLNAEGRAMWTVRPPAGSRVVTVTYNGDGNYGTSQAAGTVAIAKAATATAVASTDARTVTATVAPVAPGAGTPTGQVRLVRDGVAIGTAALVPGAGGAAAAFDAAGQNGSIRAEYLGDLNFQPSVSATVAVAAPAVELRLLSDRNPAPAGPVTFIVTAVPSPGPTVPTGSVQVTVDGAVAGTVALAQGTATVTLDLKPGSHTVAASYSGSATYPAASVSMTQSVTAPVGTMALTANPQSPVYGEPVTFTAQLPAGSAGAVEFTDGPVPLGTTGGALTLSRLEAGTHTIVARWAGDASWGASSARLDLAVAKARTAVALTVSGGLSAARVTAVAPGAGTPSGALRFFDAAAGREFAVTPLEGGTASAPLPPGVSLVSALYEGDLNFAASRSASTGLLTVVNAASYAADAFAPGEVVTIFGVSNGAATLTDAAGAAHGVDLAAVTDGQFTAVLPEDLADGPASLTVGGMTAVLPIGRAAPGIFTLDASGHGAPAGQILRVRGDGSQETGPADAVDLDGDPTYLILYGTGLRHYQRGLTCTIGGRAARVEFAGPQGGAAGVDQVNVLLPVDLKGSGRAEVVVTADGVASNAVTVVFR